MICCDLCSLFITAPTRESQASDALLAVAKMQPLPAAAMNCVAEQETEILESEVNIWKLIHFKVKFVIVRYRDNADDTVEENASIFVLIRMHSMLLARVVVFMYFTLNCCDFMMSIEYVYSLISA